MDLLQFLHTVKWLKPRQISAQVSHRLRRFLPLPRLSSEETGGPRPKIEWNPDLALMGLGMHAYDPNETVSGFLSFLNQRANTGFPPDWNATGPSRLWLYNLHYCEYIWGLAPEDAKLVVLNWITEHPYGRNQVGWEPYPVSLRLQNWCGYFLGRHRGFTESDDSFLNTLVRSVADQAESLEKNLEFHLLGNHLLENAATLALVGACLSGPAAARQKKLGLELLESQLREQVLPDGGHFERSPMYQSRVTYLLSQLKATNDEDLIRVVEPSHQAMQTALALQTHPDGGIALFNDAAFEIAPVPAAMGIDKADLGAFALRNSGYFGARSSQQDYLICDAGPIGPDYIPGHAHGDMFSFELSLAGSRVIVDSGVYGYEADAMRAYCRSTKAHNTVEVGGVDQCEFWGTFRVARRGHPKDVSFEEMDDGFLLSGEHDGYTRLPGKPVHRRIMRWLNNGVLIVEDQVSSSRPVPFVSRVHLHPDCEVIELNSLQARVRFEAGEFVVAWMGDGALAKEESWYCPQFGVRKENIALAFTATAPGICRFSIAPDDSWISFAL